MNLRARSSGRRRRRTRRRASFVAPGFVDAWEVRHPSDPGFTSCQATALLNPTSTLNDRVDLVLPRGPFHVGKASLVGDEASDRNPSALWPSDHAGVVVTFELESGGWSRCQPAAALTLLTYGETE